MDGVRWDGDPKRAPRPAKKQRKQRPCYSCEECRRLKMKCDRRVPCSNCVRRHRVDFCNGAMTSRSIRREPNAHQGRQRPTPQAPVQHVQNTPPSSSGPDYPESQQEEVLEHIDPLLHGRESITAQTSDDGQSPPAPNRDHEVQDKEKQLEILTRSLETSIGHDAHTQIVLPLPHPSGVVSSLQDEGSNFGDVPSLPTSHGDRNGSYGTLMLCKGGRSRYLGPTACSEWLKESETQDPALTRAPSPEIPSAHHSIPHNRSNPNTGAIAFPFSVSPAYISTRDLLASLPPREEAWVLVESYYRYCAWHHDVAPKGPFEKTFDRVYSLLGETSPSPSVNPQEIALVFIILAQGTMHNIEMANNDSSAEEWLYASERALVKGDFLSNNTVAGLQTLHLMAHLHLQLDRDRPGDNAWPLWGLIMRLIQAMGMHRDGARWDLPQDVVEERRKIFWECTAADTFQANCFSRPCAINPDHCDTAFPTEPLNANGEKCYSILRFELSQISSEILNMAMKVKRPEYSSVIELDLKLCEFERSLPFSLRSRAAFSSMPSRYPHVESAIEASPEPSRRSMTISFQQMNLALNISETIINLHRPYYAKALYEDIGDRVSSPYALSYLTVIERCAIIIAIVGDIHNRFPAISTRQWSFWFHVFGSALCLGTLVLRDPGNSMAAFVLGQIDTAINLFKSLLQNGATSPRYHRNLQWLLKLRARASSKISRVNGTKKAGGQREGDADRRKSREEKEDGEDVELLGWRTRLIERAGQNRPTIRTIASPSVDIPSASPSHDRPETRQDQLRNVEAISPGQSFPVESFDPTDELLRNFWGPMPPLDIIGASHDLSSAFLNGPVWWKDTVAYQ